MYVLTPLAFFACVLEDVELPELEADDVEAEDADALVDVADRVVLETAEDVLFDALDALSPCSTPAFTGTEGFAASAEGRWGLARPVKIKMTALTTSSTPLLHTSMDDRGSEQGRDKERETHVEG